MQGQHSIPAPLKCRLTAALLRQVQSTFSVGLAEHLQAAAGAHASTASSLQTALAQATSLTETLAQDVQGTLQQLSERLGVT